jgi:hypothetical protein
MLYISWNNKGNITLYGMIHNNPFTSSPSVLPHSLLWGLKMIPSPESTGKYYFIKKHKKDLS